jgi:hypothetical protein
MATETQGTPNGLTGWLDERLITATPASLEQLEEIVTDVGQSPWLWATQ